ncbi:hypothetical protein WA026_019629 [Henosepilachna vigintioctopunctata]|uniref:Uncharacterized protein n=1 Tax=Henosepilachna vigintioctopunctata TaxID=420089 RepID=A0AAW1TWW4_9CUCU
MELDDIAEKQQELGNEVIRDLANWKKYAVSKKTPEYFEKRRKITEKFIEDTDQKHIVAESIRDKDHSYFKRKFIEQIREAEAETSKYLEECEKKFVMTLQPRSTVATRKPSTSEDTKQMIQTMTAQPYAESSYNAKQTLLDDWEYVEKKMNEYGRTKTNSPMNISRQTASKTDSRRQEYQNSRDRHSSFHREILALPNSDLESAKRIKDLDDTAEECHQAISNLGVDTSSWGTFITHIIATNIESTSPARASGNQDIEEDVWHTPMKAMSFHTETTPT